MVFFYALISFYIIPFYLHSNIDAFCIAKSCKLHKCTKSTLTVLQHNMTVYRWTNNPSKNSQNNSYKQNFLSENTHSAVTENG